MKKIFLFLAVALLATSCNQSEAVLKASQKEMNKMCPMQVDEITTLKNLVYDMGDEYFIFNYTIDESKCPISVIQGNSDALAQNIKMAADSPDSQKLINACIAADVKLLYQYFGSESGEGCQIFYDPATQEVTVK